MEHQNNTIKIICLSLLFSIIGLSIGLIVGVRLGITTIEYSFKKDIVNLNSKLDKIDDGPIDCKPSAPFPFELYDSDLEKEPSRKPVKPPPIRL